MAGFDVDYFRRQNAFGTPGLTSPSYDPYEGIFGPNPAQENPFGDLFKPPPLSIAPPQIDAPPGPPVGAPPIQETEMPIEDPNDPMGIQKILDLINKGYKPDTVATDRLNQFLNQFPQEEKPGFAKSLMAGLSAFKGGPEASDKILHGQFNRDLASWKAQADPIYNAANLERQANVNERTLVGNVITAQAAAQRLQESERKSRADIASKEKIAADKAEIERRKVQLLSEKQNGTEFIITPAGKIFAKKLDGTIYDTGEDAKNYTPIEVANILAGSRERVANTQATTQKTIAENKGWSVINIPDPNDPTKQIAVRVNQTTGAVSPVKLGEDQVGKAEKLGTGAGAGSQFTSSTRTMMEGATMLLPHITELRGQATDLEKRGLFGPVMSRIRGLATRIGTTGSPEEIEKSLNDFATAVTDPSIVGNDAAAGRFATNLALMASAAGRVHGGARGGGSIQMINYMKSLLSSDSTLNMFQGRMDALDSYMKGYAIGPGGVATSKPKTKVDVIIDDILAGKK